MADNTTIRNIYFRPPLAIARLGGSSRPLDNFEYRDDPTIHGAARTVIEPPVTLEVIEDGSLRPYRPSSIQFRDGDLLRPIAPFFELWATIQDVGGVKNVPLTATLLQQAGGELSGLLYTIQVANKKAARRTGDPANAFEAYLQVNGQCFDRHDLMAFTPPRPNQVPLVLPERPIPLGSLEVIRPVVGSQMGIDLDVLRVRYTPAKGEVYGPPTAVEAADGETGFVYQIVPPANRILNEAASWLRYDGSYAKYSNPEPSDTYDGADQDNSASWGVVDDTCDGTIQAMIIANATRYTAWTRLCVGPPDYAPDRRPFLSLADDLSDRDKEPLTKQEIVSNEEVTQAELADLFQRVFETASLTNLDALRSRALRDNPGIMPAGAKTKSDGLPLTDQRSMTAADQPYASATIDALFPDSAAAAQPAGGRDPLPYSGAVYLAHEQLAEADELLDFSYHTATASGKSFGLLTARSQTFQRLLLQRTARIRNSETRGLTGTRRMTCGCPPTCAMNLAPPSP